MLIGIIGYGVVGSALGHYLKTIHPDIELRIFDPALGNTDPMYGCHAVFIAVPVPTRDDRTQDDSILKEAIGRVHNTVPIFIKSTVLPGTCDALAYETGKHVYAMPEFLTERTAFRDIMHHDVVCGGDLGIKGEFRELIENLFISLDVHWMTNQEAELTKYAHNVFAALKVNYFNTIKKVCQELNCEYDRVIDGISISGFIEDTHTQVPGPDGKLGYGGKCLPKDLSAFIGFLNAKHFRSQSLFWTEFENNQIRGSQCDS